MCRCLDVDARAIVEDAGRWEVMCLSTSLGRWFILVSFRRWIAASCKLLPFTKVRGVTLLDGPARPREIMSKRGVTSSIGVFVVRVKAMGFI